MSEFTQEQKTSLVESILKLLEAEPPVVLEEVLALISHMPGHLASLKEPPLHIHGMFYVRGDALARITEYLAGRSVKVKLHSRYGQIGGTQPDPLNFGTASYPDIAMPIGLAPSNVKPRSHRINAPTGGVNVEVSSLPIEASFLLATRVQDDGLSPIDHEFHLHCPDSVTPKINMEHGPTTISIDGEVVDVMNLTEGQLGRLRQTGKYSFQRLIDAKMTSVLHASTEAAKQSPEQQIFNILYPMMKSASTMAVQGEIERFLFTDDQTLGNNGPLLSRAGIPRPTRTDAIEYMVHALATRLRTRVTIEGYDLKWERQSAYCHCIREVPLNYNSETQRWVVGPTKTFHDDPTLELTPDRAAMMILDMASGEGSQYPYDHPFQEVSLAEMLALASVDDRVGVLAWGQRTLSEPNSALVRHSNDIIVRTFFKHSN